LDRRHRERDGFGRGPREPRVDDLRVAVTTCNVIVPATLLVFELHRDVSIVTPGFSPGIENVDDGFVVPIDQLAFGIELAIAIGIDAGAAACAHRQNVMVRAHGAKAVVHARAIR